LTKLSREHPTLLRHDSQLPLQSRTPRYEGRLTALTNSCGMAAVLAKLPHNRPRRGDLDAALAALLDR
ncbi:hypothetical protein ACIQZO_08670, partial [Streptomyces sp. NPDC097617]